MKPKRVYVYFVDRKKGHKIILLTRETFKRWYKLPEPWDIAGMNVYCPDLIDWKTTASGRSVLSICILMHPIADFMPSIPGDA